VLFDDVCCVGKVAEGVVKWAAGREFENMQNLACAQMMTRVPVLALSHFCNMNA
jgi:hypothetical protein